MESKVRSFFIRIAYVLKVNLAIRKKLSNSLSFFRRKSVFTKSRSQNYLLKKLKTIIVLAR
uniref:Uncharacterized protein n=1 Tax=Leptospira santarosai serovar Arenal str. MAVJ 401 TaxID=1049976 RepID=M6JPI1_9LEPT|nr:hypothetical protein LEP1GSC063_3988 [Leptospira santarosai serovar Arenal str. MAVJ 401]